MKDYVIGAEGLVRKVDTVSSQMRDMDNIYSNKAGSNPNPVLRDAVI